MRFCSFLLAYWLTIFCVFAQNPRLRPLQIMTFQHAPAWVGVVADWQKPSTRLHFYDTLLYKGHSTFVSRGLKRGIDFVQFKNLVRDPKIREFLPVYVFDCSHKPIVQGDKTYTWAVRLEDYQYMDKSEDMLVTLIRLYQITHQKLESEKLGKGLGLVILSDNPKVSPNSLLGVGKNLEKQGIPYMTLPTFLSKINPNTASTASVGSLSTAVSPTTPALRSKIELIPLNAGVMIGYLEQVTAAKPAQGDPKKILFYQNLPAKLPICAGIISVEPQTPLSHANLLAKNRGIPNAYLLYPEQAPSLQKFVGKLVRMELRPDNRWLDIREIPLAEAQKYWDTNRPAQKMTQTLPKMDNSLTELVDFQIDGYAKTRPKQIGTKASNYAWLLKNMPNYTRKGAAIPFSFYTQTIQNSGAAALIQKLTQNPPKNPAETRTRLAEIRAQILKSKLVPTLIPKLQALFAQKFPNVARVRLRSSTNCEDLPNFNGAGLYLSKGFDIKDTDKNLEKKILEVYASLWSDLAYEERAYMGLGQQGLGMAILINEAFTDEYANGVFISTPISPAQKTVGLILNSQRGSLAVANPEAGNIPEGLSFDNIAQSTFKVQTNSNKGAVFVKNPTLQPILEQARACAKLLHEKFLPAAIPDPAQRANYGIDVEYKILKNPKTGEYKFYVKQIRLLKSENLPK